MRHEDSQAWKEHPQHLPVTIGNKSIWKEAKLAGYTVILGTPNSILFTVFSMDHVRSICLEMRRKY